MLSDRLATLDLAVLTLADLSSIVAEEAARVLGGRSAAVWLHRPALRALVIEERDREVRSLSVDDAAAAVLL